MITTIAIKTVRFRTICGTDHPVRVAVQRQSLPGKRRPVWVYQHNLCNGLPDYDEQFPTRRAALARFESEPEFTQEIL